jgi:hypothetical protein
MTKSFDDIFEEGFHASIELLLERIQSGEASAVEIKEFRSLMKDANFFERVILNETPVIAIGERLPFVDPEHKSVPDSEAAEEAM